MRVIMPSVTTMALSTSMPIAIIMAPSEIRCSSMPGSGHHADGAGDGQ
jgi:hypothetical protein